MASSRENSVRDGVEEAWAFWLSQHPVSVPEIIQEAVERAFTAWLDANKDEIADAVAKRIRDEEEEG